MSISACAAANARWWALNAIGKLAAACALAAFALPAQPRFYVYVGDLGPDRVLLAWGTAEGRGRNTIGRASESHGPAIVTLNGKHEVTDRNWLEVSGLAPDTVYPYSVSLAGRELARGQVRTHPSRATQLDFFVLGDYGNGSPGQNETARAMAREYERLKQAGRPVRFVLTVGDNIYADTLFGIPTPRRTGRHDQDWEDKHFLPYELLLREIPFYMALGNHDGKESEQAADLPAQLDNFFFPGNRPARYYQFGFASLAAAVYFAAFTWQTWLDALAKLRIGEYIRGQILIVNWPSRFLLPVGCALITLLLLWKAWRLFRGDESVLEKPQEGVGTELEGTE